MLGRLLEPLPAAMAGMLCLVGAVLLAALMPRLEEPESKEQQLKEYIELAKEASRENGGKP